jgi:hypothetical protein
VDSKTLGGSASGEEAGEHLLAATALPKKPAPTWAVTLRGHPDDKTILVQAWLNGPADGPHRRTRTCDRATARGQRDTLTNDSKTTPQNGPFCAPHPSRTRHRPVAPSRCRLCGRVCGGAAGYRSAGSVCSSPGWHPCNVGPSACWPGAGGVCILAWRRPAAPPIPARSRRRWRCRRGNPRADDMKSSSHRPAFLAPGNPLYVVMR